MIRKPKQKEDEIQQSFVVGLRDSKYTKDKVNIVGQVSYGKGVAQTFLSLFGDGSLV